MISRATLVAIGMAVLTCLQGCASLNGGNFRTSIVDDTDAAGLKYRGLRLRSGQVVVGDAGEADTLLLSMLSEGFSPFVHAGVVVIEGNQPYVYDGYVPVGMFIQGPPKHPTGGIRRATFGEYLRGQKIIALFEPPPEIDRKRVAEFAQARFRDGTPFDVNFDWNDHSRVYCTEFVALALQAGGAAEPPLDRIRTNASLGVVLQWLHVEGRDIVTAAGLVRSSTRVALFSKDYSLEQIASYFAAKQELHARFTNDQKLGNVWRWSWQGLRLQPTVDAFLKASIARPNEATNQLAREFFGGPNGSRAAQ